MVSHLIVVFLALLIDKLVGDPKWFPHPVIFMGKWISFWERKWNRPPYTGQPRQRLLLGAVLTVSTVGLSWSVTFVLLHWLHEFSPIVSTTLNVLLISTTIAWKGLLDAGRNVYTALTKQGLLAARQEVGRIVGRDTDHLTDSEVVRATVETLAENIVDAIVSPVFFGILGGAPLAFAYRAANTLDSMVGYKNERYQFFGRPSARLDDVLNYIPARLTVFLLFLAIGLARLSFRQAWVALRRDARRHPSPNSGIPEAMVAGALSVQLGGTNVYGGVISQRAPMGQALRPLSTKDIVLTLRLVNLVSFSLVVISCLMAGGFVLWQDGFRL